MINKLDEPKMKCVCQAQGELIRLSRAMDTLAKYCGTNTGLYPRCSGPLNAAVKRASLEVTRKLAELRRVL